MYENHIYELRLKKRIWKRIWQQNDQLPVGLSAQLVERSTGISEIMGSNPVRARIFQLQALVSLLLK